MLRRQIGQRASVRETAKRTCVSDRDGHSKYAMQTANRRLISASVSSAIMLPIQSSKPTIKYADVPTPMLAD
jgi:hypothetical protein